MMKWHTMATLTLTVGLLIGCSAPPPAATEPTVPVPTVTTSPTTQPTVTQPPATQPAPAEPTVPIAETPAPEGGTQEPSTLPDTGMPDTGLPDTGAAVVENVDVRILESFPVQVQAVVTGYLPDGCTTITSVEAVRESTTFRIRMTTERPAEAMCTMAIVSFEQVVPLDIADLPAGDYQVRVNDLSVDFALPENGAATAPLPEAGAYPVVETTTGFVMAQVDVTIYAAPMADGAAIGLIAGGQMARVTGVSPDGLWWRVICPDDTVGDCWVSAATDLTVPASPPN